jgi:putative transcriptional regulator
MQGLIEATGCQQGKIPTRKTKLPIKPVIAFYKNDIKHIRQKIKLCHVVFADSLGISPKTVEAWENGRYKPEGAFHRSPEIVLNYLIFSRRFQVEG